MIIRFPRFTALLLPLILASCGPEPVRPASAPVPPPQPVAAATPVHVPTSNDWRDQPLTPGAWRYVAGTPSAARYGEGSATSFGLRCDPVARQVTLFRSGTATELTITTSSRSAKLPAGGLDDNGVRMTAVILSANDSLLDAMAFSRGRVRIASPGLPALIVPAWAEITRAIEDCRK